MLFEPRLSASFSSLV